MSKKKACFNSNCTNYKKTKYKASEKVCPHCGIKLGFVCARKSCYKAISSKTTEQYCPICKAERDDKKEKVWDDVKKVGGMALSIGLTIVGSKVGIKKK